MAPDQLRSFIYRQSLRLKSERYRSGKISLHGKRFRYIDWPSFVHQYHDIWVRNIYRLPDPERVKMVLDCGVNVGTSMAYFISQYPNAFVHGWEADSAIADIAAKNIGGFSSEKHRLQAKAVWITNGLVSFRADQADAGKVVPGSRKHEQVPAMRLRDELESHSAIDLLKLDIEGAEFDVLEDAATELHRVRFLFVEVHLNSALSSKLPRLLSILQQAGFTIRMEAVGGLGNRPFVKHEPNTGFDSQMNLFCIRNSS